MGKLRFLLVFLPVFLIGGANSPGGTHGAVQLSAATTTAIPTTCLLNRSTIAIYNADAANVCCGFTNNVTCSNTAPIATLQTKTWNESCAFNAVSGSYQGILYCYSSGGQSSALTFYEEIL